MRRQLPKHINEKTVLEAISLEKDVDGFHPLNIGALGMKGRDPLFVACTPLGCMELLKRSGVQIAGKNAVVVRTIISTFDSHVRSSWHFRGVRYRLMNASIARRCAFVLSVE